MVGKPAGHSELWEAPESMMSDHPIRDRPRSLGTVLLAGLLLATGCSGDGQGGTDSDGLEVVNIGFVGPLSGGAAYYGRNVQRGITMAADEIAEAGGFEVDGRRFRFEIVSLDDRYLPYETATAVRRLLQQNQTPVILVPHAGGIRVVQ